MSAQNNRAHLALTKHHRISKRLAEEQRERQHALACRAGVQGIRIEPDYSHPGQYIAWEPGKRGACELVNHLRCTCRQFRTWGRCPHFALMVAWEAAQEGSQAA